MRVKGLAFQRGFALIALGLALALSLAACPRRPVRPPEVDQLAPSPSASPSPSPTRKPRPRPTPSPTPTPAPSPTFGLEPGASLTPSLGVDGAGDATRGPLTRGIDSRTPISTARALETAERAQIELQRGTTDRAIELADEALRLSPVTVPAWVVRARALLAEGSPSLARADLEHAATLSPNPAWMAEIVALTGATHEAEGRQEAALAAYRRAVVIFPANQTARQGLRRLSGP
jgi:tetratricopeptide (TPR) repeat protein